MSNTADYVVVALVGAIVTMLANRPARAISLRVGYTALPDDRKVHQTETPYGGGGAMLVGFCVALLFAFLIPPLRRSSKLSHRDAGRLAGGRGHLRGRVVDDFREMSAPAKVAGEFLAASILYFSGTTMYQLSCPSPASWSWGPRSCR